MHAIFWMKIMEKRTDKWNNVVRLHLRTASSRHLHCYHSHLIKLTFGLLKQLTNQSTTKCKRVGRNWRCGTRCGVWWADFHGGRHGSHQKGHFLMLPLIFVNIVNIMIYWKYFWAQEIVLGSRVTYLKEGVTKKEVRLFMHTDSLTGIIIVSLQPELLAFQRASYVSCGLWKLQKGASPLLVE